MAVKTTTDGPVCIIEMSGDRLDRQTQRDLAAAWIAFEDNEALKVAVLHGASGFSVGHDVQELVSGKGDAASPIPEPGMFPMGISKPVIAAIEGQCYGLGFELALTCDLRVAADGALLGIPDLNLPVPYRIASVMLPRLMFLGKSLELMFNGTVLSAEEARAQRLVNLVAAKGQALSSAVAAAKQMAAHFGTTEAFRKQEIWSLTGQSIPYAMTVARGIGPAVFR